MIIVAVDNLRICRIAGFECPIGTPVRFENKEIGHVIRSMEEGICEVAINNDTAHRLLGSNKCVISLEVVHK